MRPAPLALSEVEARTADGCPARLGDFYARWAYDVARWIPAMGIAPADVEDVMQDVFLVVRKKLSSFDGRTPASWLYAIAARVASNHRRKMWLRRLLLRPFDASTHDVPGTAASPVELLESKQRRQVLDALLQRMSDKRRRSFVLFEIEGYSGEEIAALENVPTKTIWTRLHHARKYFLALTDALRKKGCVG